MKIRTAFRTFLSLLILFGLFANTFAQSKVQKVDPKDQKKNTRPTPKTEEELKKEEEERRLREESKNAVTDDEVLTIKTNIVNVDAVVYDKKSGQIITGLKKENFAIFENGVKQEVSQFATPDAPITVSLVIEYSKWSEAIGYAANRGYESGKYEVIRPAAYFLSKFIKPPDDYASVIAFDIRPTPLTDFTNDPNRLRQVVDLLVRNNPAFRENNLFDSIKFALVGGKGDTVVLENSKEKYQEYGGMVSVKSKRRAIILVASGLNTFSRLNYDDVRKVVQSSGIPIYVVGTGNMFFKLYEDRLPATDGVDGTPGRMSFQMAANYLTTFAKESGGAYFPVTFESEVPSVLNSINALLRNQYSLAYDATDKPKDGKKYKLEVKVDLNGDGIYEEKQLVVQHRPFYTAEKEKVKK
ncbi:MAG: VWA domain-containing protein [Acidobacteria bacterium]|nr:VWA domain-containing protein [Acidobacteriota bacterium]MBK8151106.1 VWA domain-containing protein [Acidobacteriota bacterium]MBK8812849.1 VWA domain-containing protein [Acidobacteriota bacterium]